MSNQMIEMNDVKQLIRNNIEFEELKEHICGDIEILVQKSAEEAGIPFELLHINPESALRYMSAYDDTNTNAIEALAYEGDDEQYHYIIHTGVQFLQNGWSALSICLRFSKADELTDATGKIEYYERLTGNWKEVMDSEEMKESDREHAGIISQKSVPLEESEFADCVSLLTGSLVDYDAWKEKYKKLLELYHATKEYMQFTCIYIDKEDATSLGGTVTQEKEYCRIALEPRNPYISGFGISVTESGYSLYQLIRPGHEGDEEFEMVGTNSLSKKICEARNKDELLDLLKDRCDHYYSYMHYMVPICYDVWSVTNDFSEIGDKLQEGHRKLSEREEQVREELMEFIALALLECEAE